MPARAAKTSALVSLSGIDEPVRVTRSVKRRSTITARRKDGEFEVLIPASLSSREAENWVRKMYAKYASGQQKRRPSDSDLRDRAHRLRPAYVPEAPEPTSLRWVTNQSTRWGSCTSADRTIRLSHELQGMPGYVIDSVLVHELAHLVHPNHGPEFKEIEGRYPRLAEAQAYLAGVIFERNRREAP